MKKYISILLFVALLITTFNAKAQIIPPYYNNFDSANDTTGWKHYAISGNDDWELGQPTGSLLNTAFTVPNVWATNLDGKFTQYSVMCLETPYFNFSDTTIKYRLGFAHQIQTASYHGGNIEYSIDSCQSWHLLEGTASQKKNWYNNSSCSGVNGQPTWSYSNYADYKLSYHSLDTVSGNPHVKFRFKFGGTSNPLEGWVIDNFCIEKNIPNIYAIQQKPFYTSKTCPSFDINLSLVYSGIITTSFSNTVKYYWSQDSIFDINDSLIGTKVQNVSNSSNWNYTILPNSKIKIGKNYIFYVMDANNVLSELNENDNIGLALLYVDSVYNLPLVSNFDENGLNWRQEGHCDWQNNTLNIHQYEGYHSYPSVFANSNTSNSNYIESPRLNLSDPDSTIVSFWYRAKSNSQITCLRGCSNGYSSLYIPKMRDNAWDFYNSFLPKDVDTSIDVRLRIYSGEATYSSNIVSVIDDIYIGKAKPDISIERDKLNRFTVSSVLFDTLFYYINNSGLKSAPQSITAFYWSNDSIFDASDNFLGTKTEQSMSDTLRMWTKFIYNKPTSLLGKYYIIYKLDTANIVDEMREYNNTGYFTVYQQNLETLPYYNDFETQITGWRHNSTVGNDDWMWAIPNKTVLDTAFSGTKAWITKDTDFASQMSRMHLYSPVFDFTNDLNPVIEFDMKLINAMSFGQGANMSYSIDGGATWIVLDTINQSYNKWYYPQSYNGSDAVDYTILYPNNSRLFFATEEKRFADLYYYNGRDTERNTRYNLNIKHLGGINKIQFRFNFATYLEDSLNHNYLTEGAMIDNFTIKEAYTDLNVNYKKSLMISSVSKFIRFFISINNDGNYISNPGLIYYYLSADTLIDSNDILIGGNNFSAIRPDNSFYSNEAFNAPVNLSANKYLLYQIDVNNTTIESNELNNNGYWFLALDSIKSYPYFQDFNSKILDGWNQSATGAASYLKNFRFRNKLVPGDYHQRIRKSGQMFTEMTANYMFYLPIWSLTSPSFDFSNLDSIALSFDFWCIGLNSLNNVQGGNLSYSIDGDSSWNVFPNNVFINNPFDHNSINSLYNEPGWTSVFPLPDNDSTLSPTLVNISFLKGQKNVMFKYKYSSNSEYQLGGTKQGMRIDDFVINAYSADYRANDNFTQIDAQTNQHIVNLNYSVSNIGQLQGRNTKTKFYWSNDNVFDNSDSLVKSVSESPIPMGGTANLTTVINHQLAQNTTYYLFYTVDADSNILETNELNNTGSFKIITDTSSNAAINEITSQNTSIIIEKNKLCIIVNCNISNIPVKLLLTDVLGKELFSTNLFLSKGSNTFDLPNNINHGIYFISLWSKNNFVVSKKLFL